MEILTSQKKNLFHLLILSFVIFCGLMHAKSSGVDTVIQNKLNANGVLVFTQKEITKALIQRLIVRKNSFVLTDLDNREKVIEILEKIFEENDIRYKVAKELTSDDKWDTILEDAAIGVAAGSAAGAGAFSIPGAIIGGIGGLAYGAWSVADDVTGGIFSRKPEFLIVQLKDEKQLKVQFMKEEEEKK